MVYVSYFQANKAHTDVFWGENGAKLQKGGCDKDMQSSEDVEQIGNVLLHVKNFVILI